MRTLKQYVQIGLVWALLPLTLLAGRPYAGCVCADGQFKVFCSGHCTATGGSAAMDPSRHAGCCGKCCAEVAVNDCLKSERRGSPVKASSNGATAPGISQGKCACRWVAQDPSIVPAGVAAPVGCCCSGLFVPASRPADRLPANGMVLANSLDTGPPPDLVLILGRLII
ncbi:MAG TPA: hypothetical protein VFE24_10000 [Pirellulales bacterium]|jgi:hypothetical protein|nr:hypothetical protein [Pirellulales bacterium]